MKYSRTPNGKSYIELPDMDSVHDAHLDMIIELQDKHPLEEGANLWEMSIRDSRVCCDFITKYGKWEIKDKSMKEFLAALEGEKRPVALANWVRKVWGEFTKELLDPNVYAVS